MNLYKNYIVNQSIRNKGIAVFIFPLVLMVGFMMFYYPGREKATNLNNVEMQVKTLSEMLAFSVGAGLNDSNFGLVQTAFEWAKKDKNVTYISIFDETNSSLFEYNPNKLKMDSNIESKLQRRDNEILNSVKINYKEKNFGKIVLIYSLDEVNSSLLTGRITSLAIAGVIVIIGMGWIILMFNRISKSIITLRDGAKAASEGDLTVKIEKHANDEIGDLTDAFNKMMSNISEANSELEYEKKSVEKKVEQAVRESELQKNYLTEKVNVLLNN
ncbi:MAG: HAMP domain-containing protein, partial [Syntrophothermus sp.]